MLSSQNLLTLEILDYEAPPDNPRECFGFQAEATVGRFQGYARFSVYGGDLDTFLDALDAMVRDLSGAAELRCGWGETVYFAIKARFRDSLGHVGVEMNLAEPGPGKRMQRLSVSARTEVMLLQQFATEFRTERQRRKRAPVQLVGVVVD